MKRVSVLLFVREAVLDDEGRTDGVLTPAGSLKGTMIPVSSELANRDFGFDENVSFRFFCKGKSDDITAGNVIRYKGEDYSIVHISDYGKIKVIHINTLIGRKHVRNVVQAMRY